MLDEERSHREQVLEVKYRDMAGLEAKFTQLLENEALVILYSSNYKKIRPEEKVRPRSKD